MYNKNKTITLYKQEFVKKYECMEKYYNLFVLWEKDLAKAFDRKEEPSKDVLDAIVDYSMTMDIFSTSLNERISICLN